MNEKNVDKIKIGDNIIGSRAEKYSDKNKESASESSTAIVPETSEGEVQEISREIIQTGRSEMNPESCGRVISGIVKWFSPEKGFGFVTCSDGSDVFVYYTEIQIEGFKTLQKGQKVLLEIVSGERGPQASNVRLV